MWFLSTGGLFAYFHDNAFAFNTLLKSQKHHLIFFSDNLSDCDSFAAQEQGQFSGGGGEQGKSGNAGQPGQGRGKRKGGRGKSGKRGESREAGKGDQQVGGGGGGDGFAGEDPESGWSRLKKVKVQLKGSILAVTQIYSQFY